MELFTAIGVIVVFCLCVIGLAFVIAAVNEGVKHL